MKPVTARRSGSAPAIAALIGLLTACAAPGGSPPPERTPAASKASTPDEMVAAVIPPVGTPRNLAAAFDAVRRAAAADPNRAELAWLELRLCVATERCDPAPIEARLRKLDPRNGVSWLGPLERAQQNHDTAAQAQILDALGQSEYVDLYWNSLGSHLTAALATLTRRNNPATRNAVTLAFADTTSWLGAIVIPSFAAIATGCSAERMTDAATANRCARVGQAFERGDTVIAEGVGLGIAERLARGGAGANEVARRINLSRYRFDTAGQIINSQVDREKFAQQQIELMRRLRREQDVFAAVIRWAGLPEQPQQEYAR